jgi:5'-AMP-activated protein kinase catalytic alpha subunit
MSRSTPSRVATQPPRNGDQSVVRIGHYCLGQTLGQGSFGKVKLAEHEITGHKVAVKILNRQEIETSKMDQKIVREIKILKLLRHPHIIRLYEVITTPTDIFMIMEYVSGGELFDHIVNNGRLQESDARRCFQQIIAGVEYIHHFRVVHRDLKPENLLIDREMNIKIADFGLSNLMTDGHFLKTSCGSPNYAAPEVISGKLYAGPEVDIWSCGVILYALLCGRLPFDEDSIPQLFKKIKEGNYVIPPFISRPCADLIGRILVVDPVKRITLEQIRKHEWFQVHLPAYLALSPEEQQHAEETVCQDILGYVATKMDIPFEIAMRSMRSGQKTDLSVAYYILLHNRKGLQIQQEPPRRPLDLMSSGSGGSPSKLQPSPVMSMLLSGKWADKNTEDFTRLAYNQPPTPATANASFSSNLMATSFPVTAADFGASGCLPSSSLPDRRDFPGSWADGTGASQPYPIPGRANMASPPYGPQETPLSLMSSCLGSGHPLGAPSLGLERQVVQPHDNWRLGLFAPLHSGALMGHIYAVLKGHRLRWRAVAPFHLCCQPTDPHPHASGVTIGIQLYRMADQHDRGYLVDLTILAGPVPRCVDAIAVLYATLMARLEAVAEGNTVGAD